MIAAILASDGFRTGLYTSPWVRDAREEIQVGGEWISAERFARLAGTVLDLAEGYGESVLLSRFDLTTAIAFLAFAEAEVDWAVVEAGLGGRLDSTNVVDKALAVVTPIDYDHTAILGESLHAIADHKLGILQAGVPAVLAEQDAALTEKLAALARERSIVHSRELEVRPRAGASGHELRWPDGAATHLTPPPRLPMSTYLECARTALLSRWLLGAGPVSSRRRSSWAEAALAVSLPGRSTWLEDVSWQGKRFPTVVLDGCHSPASLRACKRQLGDWGITEFTLILGMARDKLTERIRRPLTELSLGAEEVVFTSFDSPRSASTREGADFLAGSDPRLAARLRTAESPAEALRGASARALVIAGSLYLFREVLPGLES